MNAAVRFAARVNVKTHFVRADRSKVPEHWLTFGQRRSPQSASGRRAINPTNAVLNYLYALLEAEARIAAIAIGLDPGLGILHLDKTSRDSFALDLMEAGRPAVDAYVLDLVEGHIFRSSDFTETRAGTCRIAPGLAHQLTNTTTLWHQHLAEPAEVVEHKLADTPRGKASDQIAAGLWQVAIWEGNAVVSMQLFMTNMLKRLTGTKTSEP